MENASQTLRRRLIALDAAIGENCFLVNNQHVALPEQSAIARREFERRGEHIDVADLIRVFDHRFLQFFRPIILCWDFKGGCSERLSYITMLTDQIGRF